MLRYMNLIIVLAFMLSGDTLFNVAIIWQVVALGGSVKMLGLFLCLVTILTYVLQKISIQTKKILTANPKKLFMLIRLLGSLFSFIFFFLDKKNSIYFLYLIGIIFTFINYFSMVTVEAIIGQEVMQGRLSSNYASRMLQTAIQIAAFLGASIAGFVLNWKQMQGVLLMNMITYLCGILLFMLLTDTINDPIKNHSQPFNHLPLRSHQPKTILWITFFGLAILTVQISAFNFFVPLIAQKQRFWTTSQFGIIDAMAGLGAFFSTLVMIDKWRINQMWTLTFIILFICDALFYLIENAYFISLSTFFLGFFVNAFRIKQREMMYHVVSHADEIMEWTGLVTAMTMFIKALSPLLLSFFPFSPAYYFMLCGLVIALSLLCVELIYYFICFKPHND